MFLKIIFAFWKVVNFLFPGKDKKKMKKVVRELSGDFGWFLIVLYTYVKNCERAHGETGKFGREKYLNCIVYH